LPEVTSFFFTGCILRSAAVWHAECI
jgi:hypothetical protein